MSSGLKDQQEHQSAGGFDKPMIAFFALSYGLAWATLLVMGAIGRSVGVEDAAAFLAMAEAFDFEGVEGDLPLPIWALYLISRVADFSFTISGIVVTGFVAGKAGLIELFGGLLRWRVPVRWYVAAFIPVFLYGLAVTVAALTEPDVPASFTLTPHAIWTILFSAQAGIVVTFLLRGPMGEELGLRGFALNRLQMRYSAARSSAIIGVMWAFWHFPVLIGRGPVEIVAYILLVFCLTFIFTWIYNGSGGSLIPVMLLHTFQNSEDIYEVVLPGLIETDWEVVSLLGLLVVSIVVIIRVVRSPRRISEGE